MDIFTKKKRSEIMSKISGKETKPEIQVRKFLFSKGFRYRKNVKSLPGKPDIVLKKYQTIIFVNGCFWHGHNCSAAKLPDVRYNFWKQKISGTILRDRNNFKMLSETGWKVIIIWQCEISNMSKRDKRLKQLCDELQSENINKIRRFNPVHINA